MTVAPAGVSANPWSCACPDWADRLRTGRSLLPPLPLFRSESDRALAIFNRLRLPDVPRQPTMAEAAGDWMRDLVGALFGSHDPATNDRHLREFFALVPKKNSKTTGGAAIMVTALMMNRRPRAEYLIVAPTQEVADLAFRQAVGMTEADPALDRLFHVQDHLKRITYRRTGASLKVKSFDPKVVTGAKPTGVLLDELHVIAEFKDADRVIGQLRGGMVSQAEAFLLTITTQSERPPSGVFKAELARARAVRDGREDAPLCPLLYEMPTGADWRDPATWGWVLPNAGRSITVDRLLPDFRAAVQAGDGELRRWASQHLNVEIGLALAHDRWPGAEFWPACKAQSKLTLDTLLARSEVVVVGIDGGGLDDLLGLAVIGRCRETRKWLIWSHAWAHPIVLERRKEIAARLRDFAAENTLTMVARPGEDVAAVAEIVMRIEAAGLLPPERAVGVDAVGIGEVVDALTGEQHGFAIARIIGIGQGYKLTGSIKTVERRLAGGEIEHDGSAMMAWCVGNAKVESRGNAILVTKQAAGSAKIDPLVALFNGAALMAMNPAPAQGSLDDFLKNPIWA